MHVYAYTIHHCTELDNLYMQLQNYYVASRPVCDEGAPYQHHVTRCGSNTTVNED